MLRKGENSYVTLQEADAYVTTYYQPLSPLRVIWSVLDEEEKEAYLQSSVSEIERLPFVGRKYGLWQDMAFPRRKQGGVIQTPFGIFYGGESGEIPTCVAEAQTENALGIIAKECMAQTDKQFMTMQSLGIMKNIKYNKREAGDVGMGDDIKGSTGATQRLTSRAAERLLRGWLGALRG